METITKKCGKCKKALSVEVFGDNGKNECFKTCDSCRASGRESKARAKFKTDVEKEVEPTFIIIPCNLNTVVSRHNIYFINEKIINEFGDEIYGTAQDEETITIYISIDNTENNFKVNLGDTWGEVRENIQRCQGLLE
jgi:NAD-dependent SIR2 family protein deacetylase